MSQIDAIILFGVIVNTALCAFLVHRGHKEMMLPLLVGAVALGVIVLKMAIDFMANGGTQ